MRKLAENKKYYVERIYAVIEPNGYAYDYYQSYKEAEKECEQLNKEASEEIRLPDGMEGD